MVFSKGNGGGNGGGDGGGDGGGGGGDRGRGERSLLLPGDSSTLELTSVL